MITREKIAGMEVTFARTFLQQIRAFFDVIEPEAPTIPFFSEQYRTYRKKVVSEGRSIKWKPVTAGTEKERLNLERMRERRKRTAW